MFVHVKSALAAVTTVLIALTAIPMTSAQAAHGGPHPKLLPVVSQIASPKVASVMTDTSIEGFKKSAYRGKFYSGGKHENLRQCIMKKESTWRYYSTNRSGGYFGAYQFTPALSSGVTWMLTPEHKTILGKAEAKDQLEMLRDTPMHKWPRYWQDAAFYTVLNWEGSLSGVKHWPTRHGC